MKIKSINLRRKKLTKSRNFKFVGLLIAVAAVGLLGMLINGFSTVKASDDPLPPSITLTSPKSYQVFQRDSSEKANIVISGKYTGTPNGILARWKGGPWVTIAVNPTGGVFKGVLANQTTGQGKLEVRFANISNMVSSSDYVGIGDIFVMAGQSNMSGRGQYNHSYTVINGIKASLFGNDDNWKEYKDPYDSEIGQVDKISADYPVKKGSFVALFINKYLEKNAVPIAVIPVAKGGSKIEEWARSTSPTTLYGSMYRRIKAVGGKAKAVLWFQGENNSLMSVVDYQSNLNTLANNIAADFGGTPTVATIIGSHPVVGTYRAGARIGTINAINENPNLLMGPSFYDVNIDDEGSDGLHFASNDDIIKEGLRFWFAVEKAFYGGTWGYGPLLVSANYLAADNTVNLKFKDDTKPVLGNTVPNGSAFNVMNNGIRYDVSEVSYVGDDTVKLKLSAAPDTNYDVLVSLGYDNRSDINNAVYDSTKLPAVPFMNIKAVLGTTLVAPISVSSVPPPLVTAKKPNSTEVTPPPTTTNALDTTSAPKITSPNDTTVTYGGKVMSSVNKIDTKPTFSGYSTPGAVVMVTVHSDPVSCSTTAGSDGKWSCYISQELPKGDHHVSVQVTPASEDKIVELGPFAVTADPSGSAKKTSKVAAIFSSNIAVFGISLAIVSVAGAVGFMTYKKLASRQKDKTPIY